MMFKKLFFLLIPILMFPADVFSQSAGLSISPPLLEVMIKPGKSITQAFMVTNEAETDLYLKTAVVPFTPLDESGNISLPLVDFPAPKYFSLANSNIKLGDTFLLKAGSRQQLVLKIAIPEEEQEKDNYFTFLIEQSTLGRFLGETGGQTMIKIGANILLTITRTGKPFQKAGIETFLAVPKIGDIFDEVRFKLIIENQGKSFFKPIGKIEIFDLFGKKKGELILKPDNILVDSRRKILCLVDEKMVDCQFRSLAPGRYKASLSFVPDGSPGQPTAKVIYFWLLPMKLEAGLLVMTMIILIIRLRLKVIK